MNQAIEMFFKDRKLDPLEGVWTESNWGLVAIVKDGEVYKKYVNCCRIIYMHKNILFLEFDYFGLK